MFLKKSDLLLLITVFFLMFAPKSNAQIVTNQGRDFWVVFPCHLPTDLANLGQLRLYITSRSDSKGVYMIGSNVYPFTVSGNSIYVSPNIDRNLAYLANTGSYSQKGIHVVIDSDQPEVVVYAHLFANARSAATLVFPTTIIGSQYYVMGYDQNTTPTSTGSGKFVYTILATQPNTTVLIHPRVNNISQGGPPTKITLANAGDVYQFLGDDDYTGTYVEIDPSTPSKTFAVFSGSSGTVIPIDCGVKSYDPLFQQLYPINLWGKEYGYVPFNGPDGGDFIRVIAQEDNTAVNIAGISITLNKGQFYTTPNQVTTEEIISSDKLISVAQIALSQYCASTNHGSTSDTESDPDMVILNPIKNKTQDATTYSSIQEHIDNEFINVIISTAAASSFKVNGSPPMSSSSFRQLGTSRYSYMQLDLAPYNTSVPKKSISMRLTADDGFNAIVYGFGSFESYAYSAGISQPDICSDPDLPAIIIPNVFTPNGDELNDIWAIKNISYYPQSVVHIFNRWGSLIYSSSDGYQHPWDGTFNGINLPVATYYYVIDLHNCKPLYAGYVAIIR